VAAALAAALVASVLVFAGAGDIAAASTPVRGGTVVISAPGAFQPLCLNPLLASCSPAGPLSFSIDAVLEGAYQAGPDGLRPDLVSRVDYTTRPPFTLTYHIRPEARWSDGVEVTAKDFVFTLQQARKFDYPLDYSTLREVRSARALGRKTLRVVLRERFGGWRSLFGLLLPQHALQGTDLQRDWFDGIDNPSTGRPIGSGPFLVERLVRGKQLTLVRNPRYWGPHTAYLDHLVLRHDVDDPGTVVEALRRDTLDVYDASLVPADEAELRQVPGVNHRYGLGLDSEHLEIRIGPGGHPALKNKLVRRALAYGLDRVAIVRAVFGAFLPKMQPSDNAVFLSRSRYYRPNWSSYRYRPAKARRLLEQARCQRGSDGIYTCGGERLSLSFVTTTGKAVREKTLELAQRQLRRAGFEVKPLYAPSSALFSQILPRGAFDVALFASTSSSPDPLGVADSFGCGGSINLTGYCQRLVTQDLDQADRILSADQRARVLNRADARMALDVPVIPLWSTPVSLTVRSTIRGVIPCFPLHFCNAVNWWIER
jgi:ABC-type transport system substrate-binding protein